MKLMWFHLMPCTELPDDFGARGGLRFRRDSRR